MVIRRQLGALIVFGILISFLLSIVPHKNIISTDADDIIRAGDVLQFSVEKFNVNIASINILASNPLDIHDPTILEGSLLYFKILSIQNDIVTFGLGLILGKKAQIYLDPPSDLLPEIDKALLPKYIELPAGAGVPIYWGNYSLNSPFSKKWEPYQIPLILNPYTNWNILRDELKENWNPHRIELTNDKLTAIWHQTTPSTKEGIENATLTWDRETGILTQASILGQKLIKDNICPFSIKFTFWDKIHISLPAEASEGFTTEYILSDVSVNQTGYKLKSGDVITNIILDIFESLEGESLFLIEISNINGLFYKVVLTIFPGYPFKRGPYTSEGMAFGLGVPFLTPDWDFYSAVWATGNLIFDSLTSFLEAIRPEAIFDISHFMVALDIGVRDNFHYFGFTLDEKIEIYDPRSGVTVSTLANGEGWIAYEEDGLFAGCYMVMNGWIKSLGIPVVEGGDININYEFMVKIDREFITVPQPLRLEEPQFIPPPTAIDPNENVSKPPGGFIPGFEPISAIAALIGLSTMMRHKRRKSKITH